MKEIYEILKLFSTILFFIAIIFLARSQWIDQIIMILTLFGLIIDKLDREHILVRLRNILSKIFLFIFYSSFETIKQCALFYLKILIIGVIIFAIPSIRYALFINYIDYTSLLIPFIIVSVLLIILFYLCHLILNKIQYSHKENKDRISNISYYSLLLVIYSINTAMKSGIINYG